MFPFNPLQFTYYTFSLEIPSCCACDIFSNTRVPRTTGDRVSTLWEPLFQATLTALLLLSWSSALSALPASGLTSEQAAHTVPHPLALPS